MIATKDGSKVFIFEIVRQGKRYRHYISQDEKPIPLLVNEEGAGFAVEPTRDEMEEFKRVMRWRRIELYRSKP